MVICTFFVIHYFLCAWMEPYHIQHRPQAQVTKRFFTESHLVSNI